MTPGLRLSNSDLLTNDADRAHMCHLPYTAFVGALLYLVLCTCPDIVYTVSVLCHSLANPGLANWKAIQHLLRYLQKTKDMLLTYLCDRFDTQEPFTMYHDMDHAGNPDNSHLTRGYVLLIGGGAVSWSSHLQSLWVLSTTEAEYIAAGKEIVWMRQLLSKLGYNLQSPSKLHINNQSAIAALHNPEHHGHMKHLDLCFFWLWDAVEDGRIITEFIPTADSLQTFSPSLCRAIPSRAAVPSLVSLFEPLEMLQSRGEC